MFNKFTNIRNKATSGHHSVGMKGVFHPYTTAAVGSAQLSSALLKVVSKPSGKPICAPPGLSDQKVSPVLLLKQFQRLCFVLSS